MRIRVTFAPLFLLLISGCSNQPAGDLGLLAADLILMNGRVYTLAWDEPATDGTSMANAPRDSRGWHPDATAIVIRGGEIQFVGDTGDAMGFEGETTRVIDLAGATVMPGLVDSHTHVFELGALLDRVNLIGVATEEAAVALVVERAQLVPKGDWIIGAGWDEGAWADRYPDKELLSKMVPDHPVFLRGLHGFGGWINQLALDALGITATSDVPVGGEMRLGLDGQPSGLFLNRGIELLDNGVPIPSRETLTQHLLKGLQQMAADGYVAVHEAGVHREPMRILTALEAADELPIRVYAMLSLRDEDLIRSWITQGADKDSDSMLVTRAVKAYYDGALGSRGARLLKDYSDRPGHRGISGDGYGFDRALLAQAMQAGFQVGVHAIGDAGNRETLDILEAVFTQDPSIASGRHRIEHAQVMHPQDLPRLGALGIIGSMEPAHAVEDKTWAEERLGPERVLGAYAWRALREANARLIFNSDNPGSDHSIFYGLHAAITRRDKHQQPQGGWYADQAMTIDEAIRGYTHWAAYASFREELTGIIEKGRWADITVMDIDPFVLADESPGDILQGRILLTIVNGNVVYER